MTMTGIDAHEAYAHCELTIAKLASRYRIHFGDREAAIAEAYVILAEGLPEYDAKLPLDRWAAFRISNRFRQLATQAKERREDITRIDFFGNVETSCHDFNMLEFLDELSDDGKAVVNLVLDPPPEFAMHNPALTLRTIRKFLGWFWDWKQNRITNAFEEVRKALT